MLEVERQHSPYHLRLYKRQINYEHSSNKSVATQNRNVCYLQGEAS